MKYTKDLVERICAEFATGEHTVADVCQKVGISEQTFYRWKGEKSEFCESLKKAEIARLASFTTMARSGLAELLTGHQWDEVTTEYENGKDGKPRIKSRKVTVKRVQPNATAVIFTLKNLDSANFQDKHVNELTGKDGTPLAFNPVIQVIAAGPPLASSEKEVDDV